MPVSTPAPLFEPRAASAAPRKRLKRRALLAAILVLEALVLLYAGLSVSAAVDLMAPDPQPLTRTPAAFGLLYQTVSFPSRGDHLQIRGWLMPGLLSDGRQTVQRTLILVHGSQSNRSDDLVLHLSAALVQHGFAVLAIDLRGNGDSARAPLSLGEFEQRDILGAVDYLQKRARKPCGLSHGDEWPYRLTPSVSLCYTINMEYVHEHHSVHLVVYHFVWCPKRRRKLLLGPVHDRLKQIMEQVAEDHDWQILRLAIQPDHVHLSIRANPYTQPADIARLMKGRSSHDLREEFPHLKRMPSLWTRSFFCSTAGNVSQDIIQKYIERQSKA